MRRSLPRMTRHAPALFLTAFTTSAMIACDADARRAAASQYTPSDSVTAQARRADAPGVVRQRGAASAEATRLVAAIDRLPVAPQAADRARALLIRTAAVSIRVDSLEVAMTALRRLAAALAGTVGNVSVSAGDYQVRSATLELRVPAERFDDAMAGMSPIGKVEQSQISAEDVGEEFVDVTARVANATRLERRLVELLAMRTGKLDDVLAVERELARVREEIERHQGRIRYLATRVATSTISVTVSERAPVVGATPGRSVLGAAFVNAWRNFVGFIAWMIEALGVLVPVGVLVWAGLQIHRARRRRQSV